jgi:hypothetical protein
MRSVFTLAAFPLIVALLVGWPLSASAVRYLRPSSCGRAGPCLLVDQVLTKGHSISSPSHTYSLNFQTDANLVFVRTSDNHVIWSTNTAGTGATKLWFKTINAQQELYQLELTDDSGNTPYWFTHINNSGVYVIDPYLAIQDDGNLVVYEPVQIWSSNSDVLYPPDYDNRIGAVYFLSDNTSVFSRTGAYLSQNRLCTFETENGRMRILYHDPISGLDSDLWDTNTTTGTHATMQTDGNFVLFNAQNQVLFSSGTANHPLDWMVWQYDCNLAIYDPVAFWAISGIPGAW